MFCSDCGKKLDEGSRFCANCGASAELVVKEEKPVAMNPAGTAEQHDTFPKAGADILRSSGKKMNTLIYIISAILLFGLFIFIIAIVRSNNVAMPSDYLKQGNEALANKKYQEAIAFYEKIGADTKDYQEAQNQINYAKRMIIQAELENYEANKNIGGLDQFIEQHSGTEHEQKAREIRNRLMEYFHARQNQFEQNQMEFGRQYGNGRNDVARSNTFNESNHWSASFMKEDNYRFYDWQGTLLTLSTTKGGNEVAARINSNNIMYIAELSSSSPAYQKMANVETFKKVRFSGVFKTKKDGSLMEDSITELGKMLNPEFKIDLTDISMDDSSGHSQSNAGSSEIKNFDLLNRRVELNNYILKYLEGGDYKLHYLTLVNGVFETGEKDTPEGVIYKILKESICYADLDGDGSEEVIFRVYFNAKRGNGSPTIIEIYRMKDGKPALVAHVNQETLSKDFNRYYPDSIIWEELNFKVDKNRIFVFVNVDGFHARADYIGRMTYTLTQNGLKLMGKPELRKNE